MTGGDRRPAAARCAALVRGTFPLPPGSVADGHTAHSTVRSFPLDIRNLTMKALSASVIALAGAVILSVGSLASNDAQGVLHFIGAAVGLTGLITWGRTVRDMPAERG